MHLGYTMEIFISYNVGVILCKHGNLSRHASCKAHSISPHCHQEQFIVIVIIHEQYCQPSQPQIQCLWHELLSYTIYNTIFVVFVQIWGNFRHIIVDQAYNFIFTISRGVTGSMDIIIFFITEQVTELQCFKNGINTQLVK